MTKSIHYKIKATPYFKLSLQRLNAFLSRKHSEKYSLNNKKVLQQKIMTTLSKHPYIAPVSTRLINLGISNYRQWSIDGHNIIFYRVDEQSFEVVLLLAMDARQDIQKLLYELVLLE